MGDWVELQSDEVDVSVPAADAFAVISDYPRWPEWSPWLEKVVLVDSPDGELASSTWFLNVKGIEVSWGSQVTEQVSPSLVRWESTSGVRNGGSVRLLPTGDTSCRLSIQLRYQVPRLVAKVFSASFVSDFVSRRLNADLLRFASLMQHESL